MARSHIPDSTALYWAARRVEVPVWTDKSGRTKKFRAGDLKVVD